MTTGHWLEDGRIFHKEAVSLAKRGFEVAVLGPANEPPPPRMGVTFVGVPIAPFRNRVMRKSALLFRIRMKSLLMRCHVYHCHEMDAVVAVLPNIFFGSRIIYDVHEHFPENYCDRLGKPWLALLRILDRLASRVVHLVMTVDETLADKYRTSMNVAVVHNYPIYDSYLSSQQNRERNLAIYVGGITEERGICEMIEGVALARARHGGLHLKMVGKFVPPEFRTVVEQKITELGLSEAVEIIDWGPFEGMPEMIQGASIGLSFLRPVRRYSLAIPTKVYEYMAAGIPVVASSFKNISRFLESEQCGITAEPGSARSFSDAICFLLENSEEMERMGRNGRLAVREKYNWENESRILVKSYERITGIPGRP